MSSSDSDSSSESSDDDSSTSSSESEPPKVMSPNKTSNAEKEVKEQKVDEEPDAAGDNQQKKVESFKWTGAKVNELVHTAMLTCDQNHLSFMPYDQVNVDWDTVAQAMDLPRARCEEKWKMLLKSTRRFRTLSEVMIDVLLQHHKSDLFLHNKNVDQVNSAKPFLHNKNVDQVNSAKLVEQNKEQNKESKIEPKKKRKKPKPIVNRNHPRKPKLSAYSIFCEEKAKTLPEIGIQKMIKLGTLWKETEERLKARYQQICDQRKEEYLEKVKEYAALHPEDTVIQKTLADLLRGPNEGQKKEVSSKAKVMDGAVSNPDSPKKKFKPLDNASTSQEDLNQTLLVVSYPKSVEGKKKDNSLNAKVNNGVVSNPDSPKKKSKPLENASSSQEDQNQTMPVVSNPKSPTKRHHSDTELSSKKKKKKKARKVAMVTAEDVFMEEKFDDYKVAKPDMDDNDIRTKLTNKFAKLKDKKKAKFQALADERNR